MLKEFIALEIFLHAFGEKVRIEIKEEFEKRMASFEVHPIRIIQVDAKKISLRYADPSRQKVSIIEILTEEIEILQKLFIRSKRYQDTWQPFQHVKRKIISSHAERVEYLCRLFERFGSSRLELSEVLSVGENFPQGVSKLNRDKIKRHLIGTQKKLMTFPGEKPRTKTYQIGDAP